MSDLLKADLCAKFVKALLNQLGSDTQRKALSNDILDIFKAVEQQGGFGRNQGPFLAEGGSTVGNKDAFVNINFYRGSNAQSRILSGRITIHELLHVASGTNRNYSHYEMARAAYEVAKAQGYKDIGTKPSGGDPGGRDERNSNIFSDRLFAACK